MEKCCALVLAAGKGTRMHADKPKVLQNILGSPMLAMVYEHLQPIFGQNLLTVVGYGAESVEKMFAEQQFVLQQEQLGTGHALNCALPRLKEMGCTRLLVINGDAPLISTAYIRDFCAKAISADLAFATCMLDDPGAYGRVVRKNGEIAAIVEAKNYDAAQYGEPSGEINAGLYLFSLPILEALLPKIERNVVSGEYYITDLIELALSQNCRVMGIVAGYDVSLLGVNSPKELVKMEDILRAEIVAKHLENNVILHAAESVRISPWVEIEPGCEIYGPCEIYGHSRLCRGSVVESHCVLRDVLLEEGCVVRSFSYLEGATVGPQCLVGPYARLRIGAILERSSHVGNFVELKNTRLGEGAKANHLSYLGDALIGARTNIGAGTITCNYDGQKKHQTIIGEHAFIGSNTALVAPVRVGNEALIGAGSTITVDVPEGNLGVGRARQKNLLRRKFNKN
ncbi:MAG: bifunctional UDP-N-acetylglucosamine diphosphorylase/glucosamine-1-phosphate N-acetyltransferase GlmU [Desulfovibrio sp.]|nr:bifunctional UDP-N-acetylglucosamine diphosphorylase/glucosamine-1-phosphate N-acetyltransferase GlmU [Desulfovibrio sp.]